MCGFTAGFEGVTDYGLLILVIDLVFCLPGFSHDKIVEAIWLVIVTVKTGALVGKIPDKHDGLSLSSKVLLDSKRRCVCKPSRSECARRSSNSVTY